MARFEFTTSLPFAREEVFDWFSRPGALQRLTPPFSGSVRSEPDDGLQVGSTAMLGIGAPGGLGLGLGPAVGSVAGTLRLPGWARAEIPWRARHVGLVPGRSFTDVMDSGPLDSWRHEHLFEDDGGGTLMRDTVTFTLPLAGTGGNGPWRRMAHWGEERFTAELQRMFEYRERQLIGDLLFHARHRGTGANTGSARSGRPGPSGLRIAISGSSGLIGTQLRALLQGGGHDVMRLVRRPASAADEIGWDPDAGRIDAQALAGCDAVVHLAGHPIGGRFTPATKQRIMASRTAGTSLLARTLADLSADGRRRSLVSGSAIGYYGASPQARRPGVPDLLVEDCPPGTDFLADVCAAWEASTVPAARAGVRVATVRTGIVQSPAGGALQRMLPLFMAGLGGPLAGAGQQSWIGVDDCVSIFAHAVLDGQVDGPVNAVAPHPVDGAEYAATLARVLHRPAAVPVPGIGPALLLGAQGAREIVQADQRVSSRRIQSLGYEFREAELERVLRHVLGR
ncbi:TIGR01777 family oxidoreductase [Arthrobacter sp. JSM 101049]|uniref:TIGR01777 family oxidoreductase n=1 Tax=Arthrobacter sp. JSM 101049 TaxID=929097 RepID=UPI00356422F7